MKPGPAGSELLYYQDLDAESSRYGSIIIEPLTLWCGDMTLDIAPEDQFVLSVYMYQVLKQHLGHDFTIVDEPGPGVMRLRISVIDFPAAPTGMHTVSAMPPPATLLEVGYLAVFATVLLLWANVRGVERLGVARAAPFAYLAPVAAVVGGLQATEALKLILGVGEPLSGRLLVYDGLRPRARTVEFGRDPRCAAPHNPAL